MRVYYSPTGQIFSAFYDAEIFFIPNEPAPDFLTIDEIPENQALCRDLRTFASALDEENVSRWYVQDGDIFERDDWNPRPIP